ncbi:MAG: hypothetical protein ACJ72N_01070 [Labedaea sp.]
MTTDLPPIPPGPADVTHPRRALARLALSASYREVTDFAAGGVPTISDEYGDSWDDVDHAARLVAMAQDVLARAVVHARERGGTWDTIADALDTTAEQAHDQYADTVNRWDEALDRPWERSGPFLASRMPDGTSEPDQTIADLDRWCLCHLERDHGARHNARHDGTEDRLVSAHLPTHTPITEIASLTRTATYLTRRGTETTQAEREAYQARKTALLTRLDTTGGSA